MQKPKFELKKVVQFQGRNGYGLNADLYVNGKYVCFVRDAGNGGEIDYDWNILQDEKGMPVRTTLNTENGIRHRFAMNHQQEYDLLHAWVDEQPNIESEFFKDGLEYSIDFLIDEILEEQEKGKFKKKMLKDMKTKILIGKKNEDGSVNSYSAYKMYHPKPLPARGVLQNFIDTKVKPALKDGEEILNTNLEELELKA